MASGTITPALPTSDLRSDSKAYRRNKNHVVKWSRGGRVAPGKGPTCPHDFSLNGASCNECVARPMHRDALRNGYTKQCFRRQEQASIHDNSSGHRTTAQAKKALHTALIEAQPSSDSDRSGSDEEVASQDVDGTNGGVPESEVMYSYDARSGPSTGTDILSNAVIQAVKRYENKQTEQLVKNEYDLVQDAKELDAEDAQYAGDAEDEFEMIDHEHIH